MDSERARKFADVHNFKNRDGSQSSLMKRTAGSVALQEGQDKSLKVFEDRIDCLNGSGTACYDSVGTTTQTIPALIKKTETETHIEHDKCQKDFTDIKGSKRQTYYMKGNLGKTCYDWGMVLDCDDNGIAGYGCDSQKYHKYGTLPSEDLATPCQFCNCGDDSGSNNDSEL